MREVAARAASSRLGPVSTMIHSPDGGVGLGADSTMGEVSGWFLWRRKRRVASSGALDAVDADFAIALCGVAVAAAEERAGDEDGEIECGAGGELADVEIAAEGAGWAGAEATGVGAGYSHDSEKGTEGYGGWEERGGLICFEIPVEEIRGAEAVFEEAEAFYDAGPAPAVMLGGEDVDLEDVAGGGVFDPDGAGEGVDAGAVDGEILLDGHAGMDLCAAGVYALDGNFIAGCDVEARGE